jgi:hypothetical protein
MPTADETWQELQAQERRYRQQSADHRAKADKHAEEIGKDYARAYEHQVAEYYRGNADGIRETLRVLYPLVFPSTKNHRGATG